MKKFAYLLMGEGFQPDVHRAEFAVGSSITCIRTARSLEEARQTAVQLQEEGFGVIELCGAFGESGARELIAATGGEVGVAFVSHLPEQEALFRAFFGGRDKAEPGG